MIVANSPVALVLGPFCSKQRLPSLLRALSSSKVLPALRRLELRASGNAKLAEAGDQCGAVLAIVAERCIGLEKLVVSESSNACIRANRVASSLPAWLPP